MTDKTEVERLREALAADIAFVQTRDRPLPWVVHSGCSFRRIASDSSGPERRSFPDGNVLAGTVHHSDGHPDLTMGEDQLNALVRIVNAIPSVIAALASPAPRMVGEAFQARVHPWLMACFGEMIAGDREERNHRFLEEALELVQSCGCDASEAHQLVDYVYGREIGDPPQEVGGVMVTLAALCLANGMEMHVEAEVELARIWTKVEAIRAKQAAKPKHSPLPQHASPAPRMVGEDQSWRCFHCGDVFTDERCARLHFGRDEGSEPACCIKAGAEQGLLGALRDAEYAAADALQAIADESTEAARAYHAQMTRHNRAIRNAEEAGYERGLADGRTAPHPTPNDREAIRREALEEVLEVVTMLRADLAEDDHEVHAQRIAVLDMLIAQNGSALASTNQVQP